MITIGITTSPRAVSYLGRTVMSILAASERRPTILIQPCFVDEVENRKALVDAGCTILAPLWDTTLEDKCREIGWDGQDPHGSEWRHRGLQLNSDLLLARLVARGEPWFVTMQDDVDLCRRGVDRIAQVARTIEQRRNSSGERIGIVSFYSPYQRFSSCRTALNYYPDGTFYGDLCLLWRRGAAVEFLKHSRATEAHDLEIQRVMKNHPRWQIYAHAPCLAQHTGLDASARGATNGGQRTTMNYQADHDAIAQGRTLR